MRWILELRIRGFIRTGLVVYEFDPRTLLLLHTGHGLRQTRVLKNVGVNDLIKEFEDMS